VEGGGGDVDDCDLIKKGKVDEGGEIYKFCTNKEFIGGSMF
jgi:hypothetical protein